jgi:exodeoxyribonuclease VII large subunit
LSGSLRPATLRRAVAHEAQRVSNAATRLTPAQTRLIAARSEALSARAARLRPEALVADITRKQTELERLTQRLIDARSRLARQQQDRIAAASRLLDTLSYRKTLERGYAVVRSGDRVITSSEQAKAATRLEIEFADGRFAVGSAPSKSRKSKDEPPQQRSLF